MVRSVTIARVHDGLPLAASMDDDELDKEYPEHKSEVKSLLRKLGNLGNDNVSVEAGNTFIIHLHLYQNVAFIVLCDRSYPKKLAYSFLTTLQTEFIREFGPVVESATRPYAFIKFDSFIQKTKKSFQDARARQNLDRLQEELLDVTKIMTTSINDVLERGSKLESMSLMSSNLSAQSRKYLKETKRLNLMLLWRTYGPMVIFGLVLVFIFYVYYKFF